MSRFKTFWMSAFLALALSLSLSIPADASFTGTPVVVDSNLDGKDHYEVKYSQTGLGAVTVNDYVNGFFYRTYSVDLRYTAGGTLALKVYVSNEDVASGSVSNWVDKSTALLGSASIGASGVHSFVAFYRWIRFEWAFTGAGNALDYEIIQGW